MSEQREFPIPLAGDAEIAEFIARYGLPYDPETDAYDCGPFVADIREGKNDPIYNAHSYHTKVPPRAIIPYILHYTQPGDVVLDPFCGSGMTGVAAMMCAEPPRDILEAVPGAKKGARRAILNDLSPAACHIAYNYCTPVDVAALKQEFERIKEAVKEEFAWLYGTEHYEPAVGLYDPKNPEVAGRLKNPLPNALSKQQTLVGDSDRNWELLDRADVEKRLGYSVRQLKFTHRADLPGGTGFDPSQVPQWIVIPSIILYTIWSEVYRCQGTVTIQESTGKVSTRGKNKGKPTFRKRSVARGCGQSFTLWDVAVDFGAGKVVENFECPHCRQIWSKTRLAREGVRPVLVNASFVGFKRTRGKRACRILRTVSRVELDRLAEIEHRPIPYWTPAEEMHSGRDMYVLCALHLRNIRKAVDFYSRRNLYSLAALWHHAKTIPNTRLRSAMLFVLTSFLSKYATRLFNVGVKRGQINLAGQLPNTLYPPSIFAERNYLELAQAKFDDLIPAFMSSSVLRPETRVLNASATNLGMIPDNSFDYIFMDPPFGSNIFYADCSFLWESWLGSQTNLAREAVISRSTRDNPFPKAKADYETLMQASFREAFRVLKPGRACTVEFNNSDGDIFEIIKRAVRAGGFEIENMAFLDKVQKTFKGFKGESGAEDVVGHDVIFNLRKPDTASRLGAVSGGTDLARSVAEIISHHLCTLPQRMKEDPLTYTDEHRTTAFLNTMLINSLIPKGVDVSQLNLPFIDGVCSRYFKKIDNRWYRPEEGVGARASENLFEVEIKDETTALQWLHRCLSKVPQRIGDLRPHWMKATVKLTSELSTRLERYPRENFWFDRGTRQWRVPTEEELAQLHNLEQQRARHDAERFLADKLQPRPADMEILAWIGHLYDAASFIEQEAVGLSDTGEETGLPEDAARLYAMMPRLLGAVLKENVEAKALALAQRQCRVAARKLEEQAAREQSDGPQQRGFFDDLEEEE
jgi:16S rRNA G966 N2-methylase RsmD